MKDNGRVKENIDTLKDEVLRLRQEFSNVSDNILDISRKAYKTGNKRLGHEAKKLHTELGEGLESARRIGGTGIDAVETRITQKPLLSVLIAFLIGVLAGKLMDRD